MAKRLLKITEKELQALIETAESCYSIGDDFAEALEAVAAYKSAMKRNGEITIDELQALIETADTCNAMGADLTSEAKAAIKAYQAVLKRNGLVLAENTVNQLDRIENIR